MSDEIKNEEVSVIPQLTLELLNPPVGGDNGTVFATNNGWECSYPDGTQEILIECKGLMDEFTRIGLNDQGQHIELPEKQYERGDIVSHTVTMDLLDSLDITELRKIGDPIGVKGVATDKLRNDIAVKLGLK